MGQGIPYTWKQCYDAIEKAYWEGGESLDEEKNEKENEAFIFFVVGVL